MADLQAQTLAEHGCVEESLTSDEEAYKQMFFAYYPRLLSFVEHYVVSRESADDIVQDLFVDLWQRRQDLVIHSSLKAYLYATAHNRALNFLRLNKTRRQYLNILTSENDEMTLLRSVAGSPIDDLERKERALAVQAAIRSLPERCRVVLTLHWYDGLRYAEIAEVLKISVKTVENHMARAFKLLHHQLFRHYPLTFVPLIPFHEIVEYGSFL